YADGQWHNITERDFPRGLSGGDGRMIAASGDYLYAITRRGNILGRVPRAESNTNWSYWEKINLPAGEHPIDIRFRDGSIFVASSDGDIFRREPGSGWVMEN